MSLTPEPTGVDAELPQHLLKTLLALYDVVHHRSRHGSPPGLRLDEGKQLRALQFGITGVGEV